LLAYVRLIVNPFDHASLFRIINCPPRTLGPSFEELFYTRWHTEPFLPFTEISKALIRENALTKSKKTSLDSLISIFEDYTHTTKSSIALEHIIQKTNYIEYLRNSYEKEEAESRIENIKELVHAFRYFEANNVTTLEQLLDEIALMQEKIHGYQEKEHPVVLMTLHAAKGLEFDTVIITGLDEGILPSFRSLENKDAIEEERRLLYVGITRAKERLMFTHSRYRYTYGQMAAQCCSRFLQEIPRHLQQPQDVSYWNNEQLNHFFLSWVGTKKSSAESSLITFGPASSQSHHKKKNTLPKNAGNWKKNQPVCHPTFGVGIVKQIEEKSNNNIYLTISFKAGIKKIAAHFLKKI